jgi:hypothetical protein
MNRRALILLCSSLTYPAAASEAAVTADGTADDADDATPAAPAAPPPPVASPARSPRVAPASTAERSAAPATSASAGAPEELVPERFSIDLSSRRLVVRDDAIGLFSGDRAIGLGGLAGRFSAYHDGPWTVSVGAAIEGRAAMSGKARGASVSVAIDRPTLRGEVAYALTRNVDAVGAVGLGAEKLAFRYATTSPEESASTDSWKATADLAVGVDAHVRLGPVLLGARLEGGYLASGAHDLRVTLPEVGDVARQPIDLGPLATGGPFTRFALRIGY